MSGTLAGTRVIAVAGIGPGPFCAMGEHTEEALREWDLSSELERARGAVRQAEPS